MLRHQYFAYHALIRLAPIRVSGENHLDSRALPDRPARLCSITPTPLRGLTVIVADQRPFDELMVVLRDLHMSEALPIPARIPPLPRAQRHGQRLPAGNGPGTGAGLRGVGDGGEQPAQLDRGRELAALLVDGADRGGLSLGDDEHAGRMGVRIEDGKLTITVFRSALANAICWRRGRAPGSRWCSRGARHDRQCEEQEIGDG